MPARAEVASKAYVDEREVAANRVTDVTNYTGDLASTTKYPSMAVAQQIAGAAASGAAAGITNKLDKTKASDANGVMVRNSNGTAMKALGTDVSVANDGTLTVNNAQVGAAKVGNADSTDKGKAVMVDASGKLEAVAMDTTPTQNSEKPVTSGGVYTALAGKANEASLGTLAWADFSDLPVFGTMAEEDASNYSQTGQDPTYATNAFVGEIPTQYNISGDLTVIDYIDRKSQDEAVDAASSALSNVARKLDDGASGYDIDAKTLKVQGVDVLTSHQDISGKLDKNTAITGATKTKITYDAKGLVTAGADLAASDIPDISATYVPQSQTASTSGAGIIAIADATDISTGTNTTKAVTPAQLAAVAATASGAASTAGSAVQTVTTSGTGAVVTGVSANTNGTVTVTKGNVQIPSGSENATTYASIWVEQGCQKVS